MSPPPPPVWPLADLRWVEEQQLHSAIDPSTQLAAAGGVCVCECVRGSLTHCLLPRNRSGSGKRSAALRVHTHTHTQRSSVPEFVTLMCETSLGCIFMSVIITDKVKKTIKITKQHNRGKVVDLFCILCSAEHRTLALAEQSWLSSALHLLLITFVPGLWLLPVWGFWSFCAFYLWFLTLTFHFHCFNVVIGFDLCVFRLLVWEESVSERSAVQRWWVFLIFLIFPCSLLLLLSLLKLFTLTCCICGIKQNNILSERVEISVFIFFGLLSQSFD